jgi:hypothetical protein
MPRGTRWGAVIREPLMSIREYPAQPISLWTSIYK